MPVATGVADKNRECRLRLEMHWKELRKVLPKLLKYHEDLEKCIETSDLNELRVIEEVMGINIAGTLRPEEQEQVYCFNDMIFERLTLSRKEEKYSIFCRLLEDNNFTQAVALLNRQNTQQERRFLSGLAGYYSACLVDGDTKAAGAASASDSMVNDSLLTTLKDFKVLTEVDVQSVREAGDRKMPTLLSVLVKHKDWPAFFIAALLFSDGNSSKLDLLLPGFEDFLISQHGSLQNLRESLGDIDEECSRAVGEVREIFKCFVQSNILAFEEPPSAPVEDDVSALGAAALPSPEPDDAEFSSPSAKSEGHSAEPLEDKRRLLVTIDGDDLVEEAAAAEALSGHQMRAYQLELAEAGLCGRNTVIVAPTGSGKTLVGIKIAAQRLIEDSSAKVVFLADRTQLVDQQYAAFKEGLPRPFCDQVVCIRGGATEPFPISYSLGENSVLVLSTQILLNNLLDSSDDGLAGNVSRFRLLIFDECHHCDKEHPSKKIMDLYFKFRDSYPTRELPQIVGLTASPGTGQACNQQKAVEHVLKICANLDCHDLCTVKNNKDSLKSMVPNPSDKMHWAPAKPYQNDFVLANIDNLMLEAEQLMMQTLKKLGVPAPKPPAARGSFMYTNYCGNLNKMVKEEARDEPARALYAAWHHLSKYNFAHLICSLFRSIDAVNYLRLELTGEREPTCDLDHTLHERLRTTLTLMEAFCEGNPVPAGSSPALDILACILNEQFAQNADSRVIVFVQQRSFTQAVKDFLDKTQTELEKNDVQAAIMTGANACGAAGGTTQNAQTDTLADFRRGIFKILISTSVSEEGLDVQKCNTVVRFCHVTNEIAMVQSKGRGRAEGSVYHVIVPQQLDWLARKEKTNKMRDELMNAAVLKISEMKPDEFNAKMRELQDEQSCLREIQAIKSQITGVTGGQPKVSAGAKYNLHCKSCNKVACTSLDLRRMAEKHFVVLRDDMLTEGRASLRPRPGGAPDDLLGCQLVCADCKVVWGGLRKFSEVVFPWLKVDSFKFIKASNNVAAFGIKKWTDTANYFDTPKLTSREIVKKAEAFSEASYMEILADFAEDS